jgi:hypothetical protein
VDLPFIENDAIEPAETLFASDQFGAGDRPAIIIAATANKRASSS